MQIARRALRRAIISSLACLALIAPVGLQAQARARLHVSDYVIDAEIFPATHKLVAHAKLTVTALDDVSIAIFELHNDLRPTKVTDAAGKATKAAADPIPPQWNYESKQEFDVPAGGTEKANFDIVTKKPK